MKLTKSVFLFRQAACQVTCLFFVKEKCDLFTKKVYFVNEKALPFPAGTGPSLHEPGHPPKLNKSRL